MTLDNNSQVFRAKSIATVCHDAGGANLVSSIILHDMPLSLRMHVSGPALDIFSGHFPDIKNFCSIEEMLKDVDVLISGTGWASDLEYKSRKIAKTLGIRSIAVIDHWVNYKERFIRKNEVNYPDEIWVTDSYAFKIAKEHFPKIIIKQVKNFYLDSMVKEIIEKPLTENFEVLYILEPARSKWGKSNLGEFQALDFFVSKLDSLELPSKAIVRLRPHPSDQKGKYDLWISKQKSPKIILDEVKDLKTSLSRASIVVGCESFALVIALKAGKKVYCSLPPWAPKCRLPHEGLIQL